MKNLIREINRLSCLLLQLSFIMLLANCTNIDETYISEEEQETAIIQTDAWICDMKSIEEQSSYDWSNYELYFEDNGDYVAVSKKRLLKVSKDGIINDMRLLSYPDSDDDLIRINNDKIFRFHYDNDSQNYDPSQPIELQIYDLNFNLLSEHVLGSNGLMYDVEIESDEMFGLLIYDVEQSDMFLKILNLAGEVVAERVVSNSGLISPTNLHILENGNYFTTHQSNLLLFDNDLNPVWENEFKDHRVAHVKFIAGQGIYISGRLSGSATNSRKQFVALLDLNGNVVKSVELENDDWQTINTMQINNERICILQTNEESRSNMLFSTLDYDLNIDSNLEIPGFFAISNIVVNENNGFSFVYGDTDPELLYSTFNPRIFKFDGTYTLPKTTILQ